VQLARPEQQGDDGNPHGIFLVVLCFLAFRLFTLVLLQYGGIFGSSSDFDYYFAMAQQTDRGIWPYLSYWSEYPPVFPWLAVGVYRLAALVDGSVSPGAFSDLLRIVLLGFDLGNLLLIHAFVKSAYGTTKAERSAWLYTVLFAPLFVWLGWFDPLPVFLTLLSLWFVVQRRYGWGGFVCGLGIVTKIFPGLILLVVLRELVGTRPSRRGIAAASVFVVPCAVAVALICVPLAAANPEVFVTSVHSWFSRLPWESFWAIADGYYLFGIVPSLATRVAWPTYTTPPLTSGALGVTSLLTLALAMVATYRFIWCPPAKADLPESALALPKDWRQGEISLRPIRILLRSFLPFDRRAIIVSGDSIAAVTLAHPEIRQQQTDHCGAGVASIATNREHPIPDEASESFRLLRLVRFAAALFCALFLVTSGYSPQFALWLVPFAVILLSPIRAFTWVTAMTLVVLVGERYVYYWYFPPDAGVLGGIVAARSFLILILFCEVAWQQGLRRLAIWPKLRRFEAAAIVAVLLILAGFLSVRFAASGWGTAAANAPGRRASAVVHESTDQYDAILTFSVADYRWLGPWLGDRAFFLLDGRQFATTGQTEQTMRRLSQRYDSFVVADRANPSDAERLATTWLSAYGTRIDTWVGPTGLLLTRYQVAPDLAWPAQPFEVQSNARFGDDIELIGYTVRKAPGRSRAPLQVTFGWKALRPISQPLDLVLMTSSASNFVGRIGSQYPPTAWHPGQIIIDQETVTSSAPSLTIDWRVRSTGATLRPTPVEIRTNP